jgi:hypothetical protein
MKLDSTRWLYGAAALLALTGLTQALLTYEGIVRANVFSQERTPPAERYVPPELAIQAAPVRAAQAAPRLRLFGVAVGPTGSVALIDADPEIPGAEVYRLGDIVAGASLIEIGDSAVVLEGPRGREVLTLPSSSRRSP